MLVEWLLVSAARTAPVLLLLLLLLEPRAITPPPRLHPRRLQFSGAVSIPQTPEPRLQWCHERASRELQQAVEEHLLLRYNEQQRSRQEQQQRQQLTPPERQHQQKQRQQQQQAPGPTHFVLAPVVLTAITAMWLTARCRAQALQLMPCTWRLPGSWRPMPSSTAMLAATVKAATDGRIMVQGWTHHRRCQHPHQQPWLAQVQQRL